MNAVVPRIFALTLAANLALALTGCGFFNNSSHPPALTQGNWSISATSTNSSNAFLLGGNLTQSGSSLSGKMYITGGDAGCNFDPAQAIAMTGTVNGSNIALSSAAISGQVITVAASGSGSSFNGTYSIAGGNCDGDQGKVTANAVPSVNGTWNGTVTVDTDPQVQISVALTQATTPSADGTFALTGTVTYTGSSCPATATLLPSWINGVNLTINTDSGVTYRPALDSASAPKNMSGDYDSTGDACAGSDPIQTVALAKQ
jgi:hypothetical protein